MTQVPKDILERLAHFHREVEGLFRRMFEGDLGTGTLTEEAPFPPVDVAESDSEILVRADLPGTSRETIELFGAPNLLVIRGVKDTVRQRWTYLRVERTFGAFQRLVVLPASGDPARVRARYHQGVLEVHIPKVSDRRKIHRQIPIE
jgi:HSP20 family protein